ncbi:uncharacterized protein LOC123303075 [Chrysoperla carnea]|uniref:uncharacterized protein LOC123303075 n=1 Tax=Chrysoperla carnea TaxID=189513 RepID=UPI001D06D883|nr:uncharacterized protein LOC123303075 [Chrysoperla carnea]
MDELNSFDITKSLLQEMCTFLKTVCKHLPKHYQAQAELLIKKSNNAFTKNMNFKSEYYIDMNAKNGSFNNVIETLSSDYSDTYVEAVTTAPSEYETPGAVIDLKQIRQTNNDDECPYANKSYTDLKEKSPPMAGILRRGRKLFGFCSRKYFVIIKENWLLLYLSEKDESPAHICNLFTHEIIPDTKNEKSFSIKDNDEKLYTFMTRNSKEREQWITHINEKILCKNTNEKLTSQPSLPKSRSRKLPLIPTTQPTATINNSRKLYPTYARATVNTEPSSNISSDIYTDLDTSQSQEYAQVSISETSNQRKIEEEENNYTEAESIVMCGKVHSIDASTYETITVPGSPQYQNANKYFH